LRVDGRLDHVALREFVWPTLRRLTLDGRPLRACGTHV